MMWDSYEPFLGLLLMPCTLYEVSEASSVRQTGVVVASKTFTLGSKKASGWNCVGTSVAEQRTRAHACNDKAGVVKCTGS